ncbi:MAG: hypothetical protein HC896_07330 [Bacteroidales bacterium]|nr:hypothetical protein [Bacteroidales bacterium]
MAVRRNLWLRFYKTHNRNINKSRHCFCRGLAKGYAQLPRGFDYWLRRTGADTLYAPLPQGDAIGLIE